MKTTKAIRAFLAIAAVIAAGTAAARAEGDAHAALGAAGDRAHDRLAARQGELRLTSTFWPEPGAEPVVTELSARRSLVVGGRVLRLDVLADDGGFSGTGLEGYDEVAGRSWYVWTDTSATGVAVLYGRTGADGSGSYAGHTPTPFGQSPLRVEMRTEGPVEIHDYFVPAAGGGERLLLELRYEPAGGDPAGGAVSE